MRCYAHHKHNSFCSHRSDDSMRWVLKLWNSQCFKRKNEGARLCAGSFFVLEEILDCVLSGYLDLISADWLFPPPPLRLTLFIFNLKIISRYYLTAGVLRRNPWPKPGQCLLVYTVTFLHLAKCWQRNISQALYKVGKCVDFIWVVLHLNSKTDEWMGV